MLKLERPLILALGISLAAHSLMFWPIFGPSSAQKSGSLRASLRPPGSKPDDVAPIKPPLNLPQHASISEPPERSYAPMPPEGHNASIRKETLVDPRHPPDDTADHPEPPTETNPLRTTTPGIDLAGLNQYHQILGREVTRFRTYPPQARAAGFEGRVAMRLQIARDGTPVALTLIGSSGHPVLDQAAMDMLRLAASHAPVPDSLHGIGFNIDLAIDYNLKDAQ